METKSKFKKEYHDKLVALGVLDQFKYNWKGDTEITPLRLLNNNDTFENFVAAAFLWDGTPEGHEFWANISEQ